MQKAAVFEHPLAVQRAVPDSLVEAIEVRNYKGQVEIAKDRFKNMLFWNARAKQLELEEQELKEPMDPVVAGTVSGKRILLFQEILKATCYADAGVVNELIEGAKLVGEVPTRGVLPSKFVPATTTLDSLRKQSDLLKPKAFHIASS